MNTLIRAKSILFLLCFTITACSSVKSLNKPDVENDNKITTKENIEEKKSPIVLIDDDGKLGDLFKSGGDEIGSVNKFLWQASIEVLNFLPINSADPFSGIIVFGKGKAPGSSQSYDATVYVSDPALDARSLNVALQTRSGTASPSTVRAIEDAILTRARQMRIGDNKY